MFRFCAFLFSSTREVLGSVETKLGKFHLSLISKVIIEYDIGTSQAHIHLLNLQGLKSNDQFQTKTQQILIIRGQKWIISLSLFVITSVNQAELKGLIRLSNHMYVLYLLESWHLLRSFGHKFWHYETPTPFILQPYTYHIIQAYIIKIFRRLTQQQSLFM